MTIQKNPNARREIDRKLRLMNEAAGIVLENGIKRSIRDKGLIDSGRYIGSVTHDSDETGCVAGTNVTREGFSYPLALEKGTRYIRPYHAMQDGVMNSLGELRRIYGG